MMPIRRCLSLSVCVCVCTYVFMRVRLCYHGGLIGATGCAAMSLAHDAIS
jgi:hypothetical protein